MKNNKKETMQNYNMSTNLNVQAVQFLDLKKLPNGVLLCEEYRGEISEVPRGLLGNPRNPIHCVKHDKDQYEKLIVGDWIVQNDESFVVVPNGMFKLLFSPS